MDGKKGQLQQECKNLNVSKFKMFSNFNTVELVARAEPLDHCKPLFTRVTISRPVKGI